MHHAESVGEKLTALKALRDDLRSPVSIERLKTALVDRSSRVVGRAADLITESENEVFVDDLLQAYRRLLIEPLKCDPGCVGKTPILRALVRLEHKDAELYRHGIGYEQLEPVWGGQADTAAELRGAAAAGLVNCTTSFEVLNRCAVLLTDEWVEARIGAAHAIGILGQLEGAPLLRLKLLTGDERSEVVGSCCTALLRLDRQDGVAFVTQFLRSLDENVCIQAALALAESRRPNIFEPLCLAWQRQTEPSARENLLICIGLLRTTEAHDFLLSRIDRRDPRAAADAIKVLKAYRSTGDLSQRTATAVKATGDAGLQRIFLEAWGDK